MNAAAIDLARSLQDQVALVPGATRGARRAIAVELGRAGAFVYATGGSSQISGPSEVGRPETIEQTGEAIMGAGGAGVALRVDHLQHDQVRDLIERIDQKHGQLDVLVNDILDGGGTPSSAPSSGSMT
jgi:NAD(P)-dependent dehydrogenase (short-subunit alcohol dehydrogenase family)